MRRRIVGLRLEKARRSAPRLVVLLGSEMRAHNTYAHPRVVGPALEGGAEHRLRPLVVALLRQLRAQAEMVLYRIGFDFQDPLVDVGALRMGGL